MGLGICSFLFFIFFNQKPKQKTLKVLTYSSFVGLYGPGRELQKKFENICDCSLEWFVVEDSTTLLQRLKLIPFLDVVIGLDQISLQESQKEKWKDISSLEIDLAHPWKKWRDSFFIPLDWAPVGFIFKKQTSVSLKKLKDFSQFSGTLSFPEPESSTLGLQFYYWIYTVFSQDKKKIEIFLNQIKNKIYGPLFSWSLSYGHFQKGRVDMSLSYLTSLLYHREQEDFSYSFLVLEEGHPYQVEFVAQPLSCESCFLGQRFIQFLMTPWAQKVIQKKHYMFSVMQDQQPFMEDVQKIKFISYQGLQDFIQNKKDLLSLWKKQLY